MPITINGSGTITGLSAGGLPDGTIQQADLATGVAGTGPAFSAYLNSAQSTSSGVTTKVQFNGEEFDTNNNFDSVTNYRFTPTVAGYYQVNGLVVFTALSSGYYVQAQLFKNGSAFKYGVNTPSATNAYCRSNVSTLVYFNGTTDYIELYATQNSGSSNPLATGVADSYFQAYLVRAA